jgi:hypothetical protein
MPASPFHIAAEAAEARLILRWAGQILTAAERAAIEGLVSEESATVTAKRLGITRGGVWMAKASGLQKLRLRLQRLGIQSTTELISE